MQSTPIPNPTNGYADPVFPFENRQDARYLRDLARLTAAGHTRSRCARCCAVRVLAWAGGECNLTDPYGDDGMCGGLFRAEGGAA